MKQLHELKLIFMQKLKKCYGFLKIRFSRKKKSLAPNVQWSDKNLIRTRLLNRTWRDKRELQQRIIFTLHHVKRYEVKVHALNLF